MGFYLDHVGNHYEGDKSSPDHTEVARRPGPHHAWQGGKWILDAAVDLRASLSAIDDAAALGV